MNPIKRQQKGLRAYPWRYKFAQGLLALLFGVMVWRVVDLQVLNHEFLNTQGEARSIRTEKMAAHRGMILDRNDQPLAVSTPVVSVWINPKEIEDVALTAKALAAPLEMSAAQLRQRIESTQGKSFVYLKRHLPPAEGKRVRALELAGVYTEKEYRRYYPAGEVAAHLVGFTNIDDAGQEGMELAYENFLQGKPGKKLVMKDRYGRVIKDLQLLSAEKPGQDLKLSIDLRLQYLAYRELKAVVSEHRAKAGAMVLLDAKSGEVLALVNQPSYNPNNRSTITNANLRNRALTDVFEPGSTVKPMTVAAALESGRFNVNSRIDTAPGYMRVGRNTIRDHRNYGEIDLTTLLTKSSNIGATKLALAMEDQSLVSLFSQLRLGQDTGSGFPGERGGLLPHRDKWRPIEIATLSYGYGLSVTPLQLAQAYTVFANGGALQPVSLLHLTEPPPRVPVINPHTAHTVAGMLEKVIEKGGTGTRAQVPFYRVAGKTGTAHKLSEAGYQRDKYMAVFAGLAPVSDPRIVAVILIDEPASGEYYGGEVAAPVFSRVIAGALRLLNIAPDNLPATEQALLTSSRVQQGRG